MRRILLLVLGLNITIGVLANSLPLTQAQIDRLSHYFPAGEHRVWDKQPINIVLPVGKERLITFPASVDFGYDINELPAERLSVQNNNKTVYLTAKAEFASQRVQARLNPSNKIILLNLSAKNNASGAPVVISTNEAVEPAEHSHQVNAETVNVDESIKPVSMANLMRFAVQSLYAPKRLLSQSNAIFRTSMQAHQTEPLLLDSSVIAQPDASWRSSGLYVTAVLLRNQLPHTLTLDPRTLCGQWRAATFYPRNRLAARGSAQDSTHVFLVSDKPFGKAIRVCHPA